MMNEASDENVAYQSGALIREQAKILKSLKQYFDLNYTTDGEASSPTNVSTLGGDNIDREADVLPRLPRPTNLTVLIISWYPPVLKLSWNLNVLDELPKEQKLEFYRSQSALMESLTNSPSLSPSSSVVMSSNSSEPTTTKKPENNQLQQQSKFEFDLNSALESIDEAQRSDNLHYDQDYNSSAQPETAFVRHLHLLKARQSLALEALTCFQVTYNIVNSR